MKRVAPGILMVLLLWLGLRCDNQAVGPPPHLTVQDLPPGSAGVRAVLSDIPSSAQVAALGAAVPAGAASVDVPLPAGTAGDLAAGVLAVDRAGCVLATGSRNFSLGRPVVALTSPPAYADTPGPPVNAQLQVPLAPLPAPDCRGGAVLLFAAGWTAGGAGAVLALRGAGFTRSTTVGLAGQAVPPEDVTWVSAVLLLVTPPAGLPAGALAIAVRDPDGQGDTRTLVPAGAP